MGDDKELAVIITNDSTKHLYTDAHTHAHVYRRLSKRWLRFKTSVSPGTKGHSFNYWQSLITPAGALYMINPPSMLHPANATQAVLISPPGSGHWPRDEVMFFVDDKLNSWITISSNRVPLGMGIIYWFPFGPSPFLRSVARDEVFCVQGGGFYAARKGKAAPTPRCLK